MGFMRIIGLLGFAGLACTGLGCGDDSSGVSNGAQLATLSPADTQALCEEFASTYQASVPSKEQTCLLGAVTVTDTKAECMQYYDFCIANDKVTVAQSSETDCGEIDLNDAGDITPANCKASVGEWRACFKERIAAFGAEVKAASCENPGFAQSGQGALGAACITLFEKCPGVQP